MNEFDKKFNKLIGICEQSSQSTIRLWSDSLKKTSSKLFMIYLKMLLCYQKKLFFFNFLEFFFRRKLYMFGSNSLFKFFRIFFWFRKINFK